MLAYHSDAAIKSKYLDRIKAHAKADELIKGQYWGGGKGCAVGCTIHGDEHIRYEKELGIPLMLARLEDQIFEGLPNPQAKKWPVKFLSAIKTGVDLSKVGDRFLAWLVRDLLRLTKHEASIKAINVIADLYDRQVLGEMIATEVWKSARSAAAAAAYAYADAANSAAAAAGYAAYADAARYNHYILMADKLIELLKSVK